MTIHTGRDTGDWGGSQIESLQVRSIPETHVTPTSHFFWWRRRRTRCRGSAHAVDLSLEGMNDRYRGSRWAQRGEVRPGGSESQYTSHRIVAYRKHACLPRHRSWVRIPVGRPLGVLFTGSSSHLNPVPAEGQGGTPDQPRRTVAAPPAPYLWMNCDGGFAAMH